MFSYENLLFALVTALIGYFIGNRLAIARDKRREFNDLIIPIYKALLFIREYPSARLPEAWNITFKLIRNKLPLWKRRGFDMAIENYWKSKDHDNQESDGMGGFSYKDTSLITHAANDLLKYLKPK